MILLLLLFVNWHCVHADITVYGKDQFEAVEAIVADVQDVPTQINKLISDLERMLQKGEKEAAIDILKPFTIPPLINTTEFVKFTKNDLFPNEANIKTFASITNLLVILSDDPVQAAAKKCQPTACIVPYSTSFEKTRLELFEKAQKAYKDRDDEIEILEKGVTAMLKEQPMRENLDKLISKMKDLEGKPVYTTLKATAAAPDLPDSLFKILASNDTNQDPELNKETLKARKTALLAIHEAIVACNLDTKCASVLSDEKYKLSYAAAPDFILAFTNAEVAYSQLLPPITTAAPETSTESTKATDTTAAATPKETTVQSLDTTNARPAAQPQTNNCCQLLCLGAVQPCPITSQCGCANRGCPSSCNRSCRSQNNCCNCKEKSNCGCEKTNGSVTPTIVVTKEVVSKSSSSPMIALVSAISLIAALLH